MKKVTAVILLIAISFSLLLSNCGKPSRHGREYPTCGVVIEVNKSEDYVTIEDFNGFLWSFSGSEDWMEGDICAMIMNDSDTPATIEDDIIVSARYCGYRY